jgi:PGM1 C-terminal domain
MNDSSISRQIQSFAQLQAQLRNRWHDLEPTDPNAPETADIVVIPSLSIDQRELLKVDGFHHYEERLLFSLIRLRHPRTRLVYITSQPIHPSVIDYYLQLLPGIPFSHARNRLLLLSTYDSSLKSLSAKILDRPRLMARIREAVNPDRAYMICYNSTHLERDLAQALQIPLLACDPDLLHWGTKSGSRAIFAESGVPHPDGSPLVKSVPELAAATAELWARQPDLKRVVIKLDEGFSGEGNALLDLRTMPPSLASPTDDLRFSDGDAARTVVDQRAAAIEQHFSQLQFESAAETWANYSQRIVELGAIAEAWVEGEDKRSPSFQGRITPLGEVQILSTHDQILGGASGQLYLGCRFPADEGYRLQVQDLGVQVGRCLAAKGAIERFGVDFVVSRPAPDQGWDIQAIEINLRKGGTTHPFMTLKFLTNGRYDESTGAFYSQQGRAKYYMATDNLQKPSFCGLLPNDLMEIIADGRLHFDSSTETGSVFHLMGCLSEFGKLGVTSIGNSPQAAEETYRHLVRAIEQASHPHSPPTMPMEWHQGD